MWIMVQTIWLDARDQKMAVRSQKKKKTQKTQVLPAQGPRSFVVKFWGKGTRGRVYSASLIPPQNVNLALPTRDVLLWWILGVFRLLPAEICAGHEKRRRNLYQWCWTNRSSGGQRNCRNGGFGNTRGPSWIQHTDQHGCNQRPWAGFIFQSQGRCTSSTSKLLHAQ